MARELIWKDATSYSQREKERIPRTYQCKIGTLDIIITRIIHSEGWFLTCRSLSINSWPLDGDDLEKCKEQAIAILLKELNKVVATAQENIELLVT